MVRLAPWFSALRSGVPPLRGLLPLVALLALWQAINPQGSPYFPPPSSWWTGLSVLAKNGRLGAALSSTLITFVLAFCFWAERRWQLAPGPSVSPNSLLAMGGLYPPFLWHDHQWHRLFTAVLLHVSTARYRRRY